MPKLRALAPQFRRFEGRTLRPEPKFTEQLYRLPQYQKWRARVINRAGGRCEAVDAHGVRCPKAQPMHRMFADHIKEIRDGGAAFDPANGQALCGSHHTSKTFAERAIRMGSSGQH